MDSIEEFISENIYDEMTEKLTKELVYPLATNLLQYA